MAGLVYRLVLSSRDNVKLINFGYGSRTERWSRIFAQGVKWNFCLTAGTIQGPNQENPEEKSTPELLTGLQG
jgi:hypothetical protein